MTRALPEGVQGRAVSDYYECYRTHVSIRGLVFPGIIELLRRIRGSGRRLALFTGVEKVMMEYTLHRFILSEFFEVCITADDVQNSMADTEAIGHVLSPIKAST